MNRWTCIAACVTFAAALPAFDASPAQRTFVASTGNDLNVCSLAAPCRSFGTALTQTDSDGEIIVLDSAGYGRVTIDQSVSITAPTGVYAGISVYALANGIHVAGAGIVVALRGLTINGQGGLHGIAFAQGARLYIEQCVISNMNGRGISLDTGDTFITDSTIRDNGSYGIRASGSLKLVMDRTRVERNGPSGLWVANGPNVTITNSVIAGNGLRGVDVDSDDGVSTTVVTITDSYVSQNGSFGIIASAGNAGTIVRLAVARSTIAHNSGTGVEMSAATGTLTAVITDNTIIRNSSAGGIAASGAAVSATIASNAVSGNSFGVQQAASALLKTRANNVVQDNVTDTSGVLTFVSGD